MQFSILLFYFAFDRIILFVLHNLLVCECDFSATEKYIHSGSTYYVIIYVDLINVK